MGYALRRSRLLVGGGQLCRGISGNFAWNRRQLCCGISGSFYAESVATFGWNRWQLSRGIRRLTLAALPFALSIDRVLNGLTRPFFGWVSDRLGRENTMGIAFSLEGTGIMLLLLNAHNPVAFVILSGMVFFAWGEIYSPFPALCSDLFGKQYATANYGLLYTAKGTAALLVPISAWIVTIAGSWAGVFITAASFDIMAALLALCVLKPMRIRTLDQAH